MQLRLLLSLCLLSLPATAQHKSTDKSGTAGAQQSDVPKGRPQPMERHTRTTWRYHSGPKRNALPADSAAKPASNQNHETQDAGK